MNRAMVRNILATYYRASRADRAEGVQWYNTAHGIAVGFSRDYGVTLEVAAAVISLLSPSNKWSRNVADAERMLQAYRLGADMDSFTVSTYSNNKMKAWDLLHGVRDIETVYGRGLKTQAFGATIASPTTTESVVIDGHAYHIAIAERGPISAVPRLSKKAYRELEDVYRVAARRASVSPTVMQATTWVTWRNEKYDTENPTN